MREFFNGSIIVRAVNKAASWIDSQWSKSCIAKAFLKKAGGENAAESSIFTKLFDVFHGGLFKIFKILHLDRLFEGSVFKRLTFWCCAAVALAPVMPTMLVLGLVCASVVSFFVRMGCERDFKTVFAPANVFICLYALIYIVCSAASVTPAESIKGGLLTTAFVMFAVILINGIRTKKSQEILIYTVVAAGAVVSLYGIFQALTGVVSNTDWIDEAKFSDLTLRVYSTFENPNVLSEYLLLVIPLAVTLIFTEKGRNRKVIAAGVAAVCVICMLLTYSRGGWLGLIAAAALFLVIIDRRFVVLGIIGAAALLIVMPESIMARFASITDMSDSSTTYRISIWLATIAMLKDYWFCGIGTGTAAFNSVYPMYSFNAATAQHSHNLYLQVISECGIVGIVVLLCVLFVFFRTAARGIATTTDKTKKLRLNALMAGMFGFMIQGVTDFSFYNYRVVFMFWVTVALGMIVSRMESEEDA